MLIISTFVGFGLGCASGHGVLGAIAGFALGCFTAGFWFLLTAIYEKFSALVEVAVTNRADPERAGRNSFKPDQTPEVPDGVLKWTGQPLK
jgi:hypothetical protein